MEYMFFRSGKPIHGLIGKPAGKKRIMINGNYDICWNACGKMKYYVVTVLWGRFLGHLQVYNVTWQTRT